MRATTTGWRQAAANSATRAQISASYQPIWLVEILGANLAYSTARVYFSRQRVFGDGLLFGAGVKWGDYLPAYGLDLAQGGIGQARSELADNYTHAQVGTLNIALLNQGGLLRTLDGIILDNAPIRIRLGFAGLGYDDYIELWGGVIDRLEDRLETVSLACLDNSLVKYPTLSTPLSPQYFPATPQANKSRNIPLLLGRNTDVETIQVSGAAQGTLAFAISSSATSLFLKEFGASFPTSGSINVGTETTITYAARSYITNPTNGLTSLQLSGLVRSGTPAAHSVGEAVILQTPNYDFLIGYRIGSLQAVRAGGVLLTSGYSLIEVQANAPVSVLRFTSLPALPVTVDVNAGAVSTTNLLVNGDFEAGTLSGWTVGAGATAAVGTTSPSPQEGTYRASLQGAQNVYKDLYQDVATTSGADYILSFYRQDGDTSLLTNGGFESGNTSGWVLSYTQDQVYFGIADGTQPFASPFPQQPGQQLLSFVADGRYALLVGPAPGRLSYQLTLYQDFTTTIGLTYTVSLRHVTQQITQFFGGGNSTVLSTRLQSQLAISIGITTSPESLVSYRLIPFGTVTFNGQGSGIRYETSPAYTFAATATTTRVTLYAIGLGQSAPIGGGNIPPPPLLLDAVRAQNASVVDTSAVGLQIGTPATPGSIYAADLPPTYAWTSTSLRFRATEGLTRLTWRSQYFTAVARTSYLDNCMLQRVYTQGYNPIEQIRYIITTFTELTVDDSSFIAAYDQRIAWSYGAVLYDPGDSRALLNRMAEQCGCLLLESPRGTIKIITRDMSRAAVFGFNRTNIRAGSFSATPERIDNVATDFYVWFGARTGGSTQASDFAASTYCTPDATTHPSGQGLTVFCKAAAENYKRRERLTFYADFIQDILTANFLLEFLVKNRTIRQVIVTFETWLDASSLELGDIVAVEDPRYPGTSIVYDYEIVGIESPTPDIPYVRITARSVRRSGWAGSFDYLPYVIESDGWMDSFEN